MYLCVCAGLGQNYNANVKTSLKRIKKRTFSTFISPSMFNVLLQRIRRISILSIVFYHEIRRIAYVNKAKDTRNRCQQGVSSHRKVNLLLTTAVKMQQQRQVAAVLFFVLSAVFAIPFKIPSYGRWNVPTVGQVWPKPQTQTSREDFFILTPSTFHFEVFLF